MDYLERKIKRFDQVKLRTVKNVRYLSAPPDEDISPHGVWSVTAAVDGELLLAKNNAIIRIPAADVLVIADYDLEALNKVLGKLSNGETKKDSTNS